MFAFDRQLLSASNFSDMSMVALNPTDLDRYLHHPQPWWNMMAILYTIGSYGLGLGLIVLPQIWLNGAGVLLLIHSLVLSAYLAHEFMHGNVFRKPTWNAIGGNLMLWLNGSCYTRFPELAKMHIAHHVNRIDYCRFDIVAFLKAIPAPLRWMFLGLEWLYFPALAFLLRIRLIVTPFHIPQRQADRLRTTIILAVRLSLFFSLAILSLKAFVLYFIAYITTIHILRFVDAFQHTYGSLPVGTPLPEAIKATSPEAARAYEQANTFSNVISQRYRWLNLLMLNFGYHNAHHDLMRCPWYYLPDLDQKLYAHHSDRYITLLELWRNYHRFRVSRIFTGQGTPIDPQGKRQIATFYGAIEVSFLVVPV